MKIINKCSSLKETLINRKKFENAFVTILTRFKMAINSLKILIENINCFLKIIIAKLKKNLMGR